ncbi:abortive infection system antitoxin AbiGi family protein [Rufibacter immobilis]|uniref:abortive infection system antitoxin AbiGi family protein n=1 Tax=Rufibacter immobilis TaxID=1348778 RepID=UPI0035ED26BC
MDYWIDTHRTYSPGPKVNFPLIHITSQWETLESILKEGFRPSYCTEQLTNGKEVKLACFPMVSLSNMSISDAIQYQKSYGTFGIALDKKFGEENDFNPVLYLEQKSNLTNEIIEAFKSIKVSTVIELERIVNGVGDGYRHLLTRSILKTFAHSKNYDGKIVRNETLYDEYYPFGLEREWRKIIINDSVPYFLTGDNIKHKKIFNENISNIRIDFKLEHIKGIIVESQFEQNAVKEIIISKYNLSTFPKKIEVRINSTRHIPDK